MPKATPINDLLEQWKSDNVSLKNQIEELKKKVDPLYGLTNADLATVGKNYQFRQDFDKQMFHEEQAALAAKT